MPPTFRPRIHLESPPESLRHRFPYCIRRFSSSVSFEETPGFASGLCLWLVTVAIWLLGGSVLYCVIRSAGVVVATGDVMLILSSSALAWTIGFLTPWAPSGLGVREGVLALVLKPLLVGPVLLYSMAGSRLATVAEDVLWTAILLRVPTRERGDHRLPDQND